MFWQLKRKGTFNGNFMEKTIKVFTSGRNEMKLILEEETIKVYGKNTVI